MRTKKVFSVVVILAMMVSVLCTGCSAFDPEMKISIDGKEFSLDCKVQDLIDAGYDISSIDHKSQIIKDSDYPVIGAMIMDQKNYYLINESGVACNVAFNVYNISSSDRPLNECKVYLFKYDAGTYSEYITKSIEAPVVLLNGIDFKFTDCKETTDALASAGFKFKSSDVDAFSANDMYGQSVIGPTGLGGHSMSIFHDYDYNEGVVRVNGFEISLKLNYKFT